MPFHTRPSERSGRSIEDRRGSFALQGLDEDQQSRLRTSFRAVAGRALYRWDEVPQHQADVLVQGPAYTGIPHATAPIRIWLGDDPPDPPGDGVFHLPSDFSTHTLWGVLDLIALRLMDTRTQPSAGEHAPPPGTVASDDKPTYRLLRWTTLDAELQAPRFRMAMACMTSRDVSLDWLIQHGALEHEDARLLLRKLNQLGVLEIHMRSQRIWPAPQIGPQKPLHRFLRRVGHWLRGARQRPYPERAR